MILRHVNGESYRLTDYKDIERDREVNGKFTFSFRLLKTHRNVHAYDYVENESVIVYRGAEYVIKRVSNVNKGARVAKQVYCEYKPFCDLYDHWQYEMHAGALQIGAAVDRALKDTGFTYSITGTWKSQTFEKFGDDSAFGLLHTIAKRYGMEFIVIGKHVSIFKKIGQDTNSFFRYRYNMGSIVMESETEGFATYIRGFGKDGLEVEYLSPLHTIYGIKHTKPVRDERYTLPEELLQECKDRLNDTFKMSLELDYIEILKNGVNINPFELGDSLLLVHKEMKLKTRLRVLGITDYPESKKKPRLKLSNITKDARDLLADFSATKKQVDKVVTPEGNISNLALSADAQYTIDSVSRTFSQVDYTLEGIRLSDPVNFMRHVMLKKGGIFRRKDGEIQYSPVITPDGINLAEVFGRLGAQHVSIGSQTVFEAGYDPTTKAPILHNHDDWYYTKNQVNDLLAALEPTEPTEPTEHNHNDLYYTKEEVDTLIEAVVVGQSPVEAWRSVTLQNGWVRITGWNAAGYYRDRNRVYLRGGLTGGQLNTTIFALPVGFRPAFHEKHDGFEIRNNGEVIIKAGDIAHISLDGISFRV